MLGLSFDTKSNVSVFAMYLNATIVFSVYVGLLHSRNNIHINKMFRITSHMLNGTDLTTYLNWAVCFFPMFDWLFL